MEADPYGLAELDRQLRRSRDGQRFTCPIQGCQQRVKPPSRKPRFRGEPCPEHGVVVHSSGTWSYAEDYRRNLIVDGDYFDRHIRHHDFKVEAHRFGSERSEDAVTWNVFRSLQRAGGLHKVVNLCTGVDDQEPLLLLWGLHIERGGVKPWDLLLRARERFESDLPVDRPKTEPDIALYLPGRYVVLIEAKFCSPNGTYRRDRKTRLFDLTIDQLVNIYQDPTLKTLNYEEADQREAIHYQLWRNMIFAEQIARYDSPTTEWFHVNLVRQGFEADACDSMLTLMHKEHRHRFEQITWEQIYRLIADQPELASLHDYMQQKTERLKPAFKLDRRPGSAGDRSHRG